MASELKNGGGVRAIAYGTTAGAPPGLSHCVSQAKPLIGYRGHRAYIDNPKLIATVARKTPLPRGPRAFSGGKAEWR